MKKMGRLQEGGMLLEALAVLGLITVTAPVVYKKAVEKSQEIEDISVASQMRTIRDSSAIYIEKNYETLQDGDKLNLTDLRRYLPPNFLDNMNKNLADISGVTPGTPDYDKKINQAMTIVVKKDQTTTGASARPVKRASAYIISNMLAGGKSVADEKRGNRIASLIGSEGGYIVDDKTVMGSNNAWQRDISQIDNKITIQEGQIVAGTTFSKDPLSGDFLYRNSVEGFPQFNMMMTNLDANGSSIERIRSLGLKYNIDDAYDSIEFKGEAGELIGKNDLSNQTLLMQANQGTGSGSLELTAENEEGCARMGADFDGQGAGGMTACNKAGKETVSMSSSGEDKGGTLRQSGRLNVGGAGASDAEASAYGEYNQGRGGALTVANRAGTVTGQFIGSEDDSLAATSSDASKLQLSDQAGALKAQITGTAEGGRMLVGDGNLTTTANQTVFASASEASVTAKKSGKGYARMESKYLTNGAPSGAFLIANNNTGSFALQTGNVVAALANQGNSGYLRLSNGTAAQERVKIVADGETGLGGATYLSVGAGSRNVIMEANRGNTGSGYMEFKGGVGATIDSNSGGTSVFLTNDGNVKLSSNESNAGSLDLGAGKAKLQASTPSLALTGNGKVDITTSEAKLTGGGGSVTMNSSSGDIKVANTSGDRIIASRDFEGNQGTIRVLDTTGKNGVTMVGNSKMHSTLGGATEGGGAFYVARSKNTGDKKTGSFIANGPNDGGWIQLSADKQDEGKIDLYASKNSGDGTSTSSYGHFFGTNKKDSVVIMGRFGGVSPHSKYEGTNTEPDDYAISFGKTSSFHDNDGYKGYSYAETGALNASTELNSTEVYAESGINIQGGKLYTSVLCIGLGNKTKGDSNRKDSFTFGSTLDGLSNEISSSGDKKCIPLPKGAKWRDIVYEASVNSLKGLGALRGHDHEGFADYGHLHPSYAPETMHHPGGQGKAKWTQRGKNWNSSNGRYVGQICTKKGKYMDKKGTNGGDDYSGTCCKLGTDSECIAWHPEKPCSSKANPGGTCGGGCKKYRVSYSCAEEVQDVNGIWDCCTAKNVYDGRNSYWSAF